MYLSAAFIPDLNYRNHCPQVYKGVFLVKRLFSWGLLILKAKERGLAECSQEEVGSPGACLEDTLGKGAQLLSSGSYSGILLIS